MYRKSVKIALVFVSLVIIAGAMVRMTGSGMGCPDWPKCFGYYIPPTEASQLEWQPEKSFKKGQVIIKDKTLQVAASDFTTEDYFNSNNWELYTKHDYAIFNVWHTWIEYINRLFGALSGIAILIMAILSFKKWRDRKRITLLSWLSVVLLVFQAWLGATVVYSVLSPVKITIHMVMALVIVAVLLYLLYISKRKRKNYNVSHGYKGVLLVALILSLIQIILGTQVRQFVDEQSTALGYEAKSQWLNDSPLMFYFHRSFSILVVMTHIALWYFNRIYNYRLRLVNFLMLVVVVEVLTGLTMYYFDFPILSQPLHLIFASLLFGLQFYIVLQAFQQRNEWKSS
ncbi:cytochrome c oxidase assembly protein subunit 15 [Ulvibacter sp. MAR_2010_11]|uniref:COX15/CtaA family protein n=1 Tax=Ulvibacter sp. MAR_2010_11 TaxID=1250229 RepID=UPI000C2C220C|nr:COX15/CtaA family protein [Ulvibacter sp. MAR_2010_11]PKA83754.1 cytochrome c oxidase assembly protein subunit 15 [Ulvibacter sp. MAR_2010_11]